MIDIQDFQGEDLQIKDSQTPKAANVLSTQLASLEYAPALGVDLAYFLADGFQFQNESFKSYLLQRLAEHSVDVFSVVEVVEDLYTRFVFNVAPQEQTKGLIR